MAEEFEGDLRESEFWGVDLRGARFRDVDLSGVSMHGVRLVDVAIDGWVERLVVNGVDVTGYVNAHDPWQPLRGMLRPGDVAGVRRAWDEVERAWAATIADARRRPEEHLHRSVDGEWSFVQTLRHLVFAIDKWFSVPVAATGYSPVGLPNRGSADLPWPGLDPAADPSLDEVLAVRADRSARLRGFLQTLADADLDRPVDIAENGVVQLLDCFHTVFEEEFEHRRYALRDLALLDTP